VPLVAFLGLVHLRIASFALVFGRGRSGDDGGIDNRALAHQQAALLQHRRDFGEQRLAQLVPLQPMAEIQDCRLLRDPRHRQIDTGKAAQGLAVVKCILHRPVGQPIPLLQEVYPQHPLQTDRRPATLALRVQRSKTVHQPCPRHDLLHLGQKLVAPRLLLLAGVFRLRKAPLKLHSPVLQPPHRQILPHTHSSKAISSVFP
jgi:hypothetical protein